MDTSLSLIHISDVFAKLTPDQKARVVSVLRENGHTVGFMGDGINDAAAMKAADVGISVDTAVDVAKESADITPLFQGASVGFQRLPVFHGLPAGSRTLTGVGHALTLGRFLLKNRLLWAYGTCRSIKARPRLCSPPLRR